MQKYQDAVFRSDGHPAAGATITVTRLDGSAPTLYSTNSTSAPLASNVLTTDTSGEYSFYAPNGHYNIGISYPAYVGETKGDVMLYDNGDVVWTKGDIFVFGSAPTRLPVGPDGTIVIADSTQTLGMRWAQAIPGISRSVSASFSLAATDDQTVVYVDNTASLTCTIPNTLPANFSCTVVQMGATGAITFSAAAGATLNSRGAVFTSNGQYAMCTVLVRTNSNGTSAVCVLGGDIA